MLFLCAPPYVVALGLLLLFSSWGTLPVPFFFDVHVYAPPLEDPWTFLRSMLVPWFVVGAPLAAQFLRLTLAITLDAMGEEWVRTARAKGLAHDRIVRRHAGPSARLAVASLFGACAPLLVTNMVLVESVWSVPGFFTKMRRALGQGVGGEQSISIPTLQALSLWAAMLIVVLGLLADLAILRLDPRIRSGGRTVG
jgi:peptide/nickel transport system permease protein